MDMGVNVKAVLGSVAVCGVLLLAGCGGSSSATADSGWNPPRPSGVPDEKWATVVEGDPAALPVEELSGGYCQAVKPESAEVDAKVQEYPGATVEEFNDFYDYLLTYVAPLCADLPTATVVKGVKRMSAQVVADL
jgi:hypothetical protein